MTFLGFIILLASNSVSYIIGRDGVVTGVEGQPAIRSEIETQWWVLTLIPFPVVRRPNNSEG